MNMKFIYILLAFSALIIFNGCSGSSNNDPKPNVIIIVADDLGYGDVSCYGVDTFHTPHIDALANNGVLFTDFYVPTPYCAPSRATLLTGKFPLKHGLTKNPTPDTDNPEYRDIGLSQDAITLAEVLKDQNYSTMCIGKWHLGHEEQYFPVNQGFEEYYGILYSNDMRPVQIIESMDTVEYPVDQSLLTQKYTEKALSFINKNSDKPFFLHLCHAMPHKPLAASPDFYTPETPDDLYHDVINELDWSVGAVMEELKKLDLLQNTIVIFMSDNGPWYGGSTGGLKGMKATDWEGGIRVPFAIHYPEKFSKGKIIDVPCWSSDIFPTILALADVEGMPGDLDGEDITDIIMGNSTAHKPIFAMHNNTIMSVRKGDWKLFVNIPKEFREIDLSNWSDPRGPDGETIIAPAEQATPAQYPGLKPVHSGNELQLYNLRNDPGEQVDLADQYPDVVKELLEEYQLFKKSQSVY